METKNYKYTLRKSGKKEICPQCGKRRFVPYVLAEDNATIVDPRWGRCDRENSCGYWVKPDGNPVDITPREPMPPAEPMWVEDGFTKPSVVNSLWDYASWLVGSQKAREAFTAYRVRTADDGGCVFLQTDVNGVIRAGKVMMYRDGHRVKDGMPVRWLHKDSRYRHLVHGEALHQCFFGEHLLAERPDDPVAVVESEKTAMLMSAVNPTFMWLATGGSCNLGNPEKNAVLRGRDVTLFPDNGMYLKWRQIGLPMGWKIDDACLQRRYGMADGYDVLDLVEKARKETKK